MSYGLEGEANSAFAALMDGVDYTIPTIDLDSDEYKIPGGLDSALYQQIKAVTNEDMTTSFGAMLAAVKATLLVEYEKSRITGGEYSKAYIALVSACMQSSVQFVLGKDQAFWQAQQAQIAAIIAKVGLTTAKVQLISAQIDAENGEATYALTKSKIGTESLNYGIAVYNLNNLLPAQLVGATTNNLIADVKLKEENINLSIAGYNFSTMLPAQYQGVTLQNSMLTSQIKTQDVTTAISSYNLATMLPQQLASLKEQVETARAQTLDTRTDGQAVTGSVGKQKELYAQQIISYQRDAEVKAAKLFTDAWVAQKTIDEGLTAPINFANDSVNSILGTLKTNNELGV